MAKSPRSRSSPFGAFNDGLDHVLQLLLASADPLPSQVKLRPGGREKKTACAMWKEINGTANTHWQRRQQRRQKQRAKAAAAAAAQAKAKAKPVTPTQSPRNGDKTVEKDEKLKNAKKTAANGKPPPPTIKMLDLSGSNLSPVLAPATRPPRRSPMNNGASSSMKPLALEASDARTESLMRLRHQPMLEGLVTDSEKARAILQWLEQDDGKNQNLSPPLKELIMALQHKGLFATASKMTSDRIVTWDPNESLNECMKKVEAEKKEERRAKIRRIKAEEKAAVAALKGQRRQASSGKEEAPAKSRKRRPLGKFVVESEEEEESESEEEEAEYEDEDEDEEEEEEEVEFGGADDDGEDAVRKQPSNPAVAASAKQQLALVTARLRAEESKPTYLSYHPTSSSTKNSTTTSSKPAKGPKLPPPARDGTSSSSAIVLESSDEEEEDEETEIVNRPPVPPPTPPRAKQQQQKKQTPKKPAAKATAVANGKTKAKTKTKASAKRRRQGSDDDDSEAEFRGPDEDGASSTDAERDLFDLNEDDVYVVESILEIKLGRTLLNNSGRPTKEADLFLVKWDGYDELTWEPEDNIPTRLIQFFREREAAKRACQYEIRQFLERKVSLNSTTGKHEVLYLIQWKNQANAYWEVKSNLPEKTVIWLEKTSRASLSLAAAPPARKKTKK